MRTVQVAIVGAMQRAHPALTQLWLRWTGVEDLDKASFDTVRPEQMNRPGTQIFLAPTPRFQSTQEQLCALMGFAPDAPERGMAAILLSAKSPAHAAFWEGLKARELNEVEGPIEWWWRLLVLRCRGVKAASKAVFSRLFEDDPVFDSAVLCLENPSLREDARRAKEIIGSEYHQPTKLVVGLNVNRRSRHEGLAFDITTGSLKDRLVSTLLDLSTSRST